MYPCGVSDLLESDISRASGHDRSFTLLLRAGVGEHAGRENPVRDIDVFVDGLDLTAAHLAHVKSEALGQCTGAPRLGRTIYSKVPYMPNRPRRKPGVSPVSGFVDTFGSLKPP
jgi:hypothetical protein